MHEASDQAEQPAENDATRTSCKLIEATLSGSPAYRQVDPNLYVIKQGSSYVLINVVSWGEDKALVRCVAQLVKGANVDCELACQLLELNGQLRFGAFAYEPEGSLVLFQHSILGGDTLDPEELLATVRDVAIIADEYDDRIVDTYGGQTMRDLLEEAALGSILKKDPAAFRFGRDHGGLQNGVKSGSKEN